MKNNKSEIEIFLTTIQRVLSLVPGLPECNIIHEDAEIYANSIIYHEDDVIRVSYKMDDPTIRGPLAKSLTGTMYSVDELSRNTDDFSRLFVLLHFCTNSLPISQIIGIDPRSMGVFSAGYSITPDGIMTETLEYSDPDGDSFNKIRISLKVFITDDVVEKLEYLGQFTDEGIQLLLRNKYGIETK